MKDLNDAIEEMKKDIDQLEEPGEKTTGFANVPLDRYDELLKKEIIADLFIEEYKETWKKTRAVVEKMWNDIKEVAE